MVTGLELNTVAKGASLRPKDLDQTGGNEARRPRGNEKSAARILDRAHAVHCRLDFRERHLALAIGNRPPAAQPISHLFYGAEVFSVAILRRHQDHRLAPLNFHHVFSFD